MIKKVIEIKKDIDCNDEVELSWFDMQKPNLTAVSNDGINFIIKAKFTHLHENDILVCEDDYAIKVKRSEEKISVNIYIKYVIIFKIRAYTNVFVYIYMTEKNLSFVLCCVVLHIKFELYLDR